MLVAYIERIYERAKWKTRQQINNNYNYEYKEQLLSECIKSSFGMRQELCFTRERWSI